MVADSALLVGEENLLSTTQTAYIESQEQLIGETLVGSSSLQVLTQVQGYLGHPAECTSLQSYLDSISVQAADSGQENGITYAINASGGYETQGQARDNLTAVAPFSGFEEGALNLRFSSQLQEVGGGGTVTRMKSEVHTLHLPISPDAASFLCGSVLAGLEELFSSLPSCDYAAAESAFTVSLPTLVAEASALGFALQAAWSIQSNAACQVSYQITLVEQGVEGPAGDFDWTVQGSGTSVA